MSIVKKQSYSMKDLKCESVVVYKDRAEVRRSLKTVLNKGENEILINSITNLIDKDSVRIKGSVGGSENQAATVLDVICQNRRVQLGQSDSNENIKQKTNDLNLLQDNLDTLVQKSERITKQISVLNDFANVVSKPAAGENKPNQSERENVTNFLHFMSSYSKKLEQLDLEKTQVSKEIKDLREKVDVLKSDLSLIASNLNEIQESK
jgi:hypothetical protein